MLLASPATKPIEVRRKYSCIALTWSGRLLALQQTPFQKVINREHPRSASQKKHEDRSPEQVIGPGVWIHEYLDEQNHSKQRQRCNAGRQPEEQKHGYGQFIDHGHAGCYGGVKEG